MFEVRTDEMNGYYAPFGEIRDQLLRMFENESGESAEGYYDDLDKGEAPIDDYFQFLWLAYDLDKAMAEIGIIAQGDGTIDCTVWKKGQCIQ